MDVAFRIATGSKIRIHPGADEALPSQPGVIAGTIPRLAVTIVLDSDTAIMVPLRRSEARAIASALMGAAAEL